MIIRPYKYIKQLFFVLSAPDTSLRGKIRSFYHFCEGVYLARAIKRDNIKHIHVHFAAGAATAAMVVSKLLSISFSFTAHGTSLLVEGLLLQEKITSAKFIIAISKHNRDFIVNMEPNSKRKTFVVNCGVDTTSFLPPPPKKDIDNITILSVGSLRWQKNYTLLVKACNYLKQNSFQFQCIIIGEGPERQRIEKLIQKLKLDDFIKLKGAVLQEKIQNYYDLADIFVLPSVSEGIPVALMEAMSKEVAVISTQITGIPEIIEHLETGILVSPGNVRELADAIALLIENYDLRRELGKNGRARVVKDFNIHRNVLKLKTIFESEIS